VARCRETGQCLRGCLPAAECGLKRGSPGVPHVVGDIDRDRRRNDLVDASGDPIFGNNRARVLAAARPLFAAAQDAREIRDDLTLEQALDMIIAIAALRGDARYLEPILQTALDGLRPPADAKPAAD
jgi:hypothetical protein